MKELTFEAIGTGWQITINQEIASEEELLKEIQTRIAIFDRDYSRFRTDSLVTQMAQNAGTYRLPTDAKLMFDLYEELYTLTNGSFTPLIGRTMEDTGYDATYRLTPREEISRPENWSDVLEYHYPEITLKKPTLLDVGAIGKGYLIDIVSDILKAHSITSFAINAGGDVYHYDIKGEKNTIGLEDPENLEQLIGTVLIGNESICGSSGNRRVWGTYHHIIDPYTLSSPRHILATWAIAESTILADAMATCLFLTDRSRLINRYKFEYLILFADRSVEQSGNFPGELFLS